MKKNSKEKHAAYLLELGKIVHEFSVNNKLVDSIEALSHLTSSTTYNRRLKIEVRKKDVGEGIEVRDLLKRLIRLKFDDKK